MRAEQTWDPSLYADKHAFVWKHGTALVDLLAPRPGERILDLGCGTGQLTAQISSSGAIVVGLDQSSEMITQAHRNFPHLDFVLGDARDFTFADRFDAVFSNAVLHWIKEPVPVIASIVRALKPGGRFVAEFGGRGNVQAILAALRVATSAVGVALIEPLWYFPSIGEYAPLLENAGLEVRLATLFDRPTPLEGESGLRDWVRMFAPGVLASVPAQRQEEFLDIVESTARLRLRQHGWFADYRRLRVLAVAGGMQIPRDGGL